MPSVLKEFAKRLKRCQTPFVRRFKRPKNAVFDKTCFPVEGHICDTTYKSAVDTFGKRERKSPDWFEAGIEELEPAISCKRTALLNYKQDPSEKTLAALR